MTEFDNLPHICRNCGVVCVNASGAWSHPETWRSQKTYRCDSPEPLRQAKSHEVEHGGQRPFRRDRWMKEEQLHHLVVPVGSPVDVAIVGHYDRRRDSMTHPRGWGYLASDGHYGYGATTTQRRFDGPGELAAEARALFWAVRRLVSGYRVAILTDQPEIKRMVDAWRQGDLTAAHPEYDHSPRESGRPPKLTLAAHWVYQRSELVTVKLVENYAATPLGVCANKLAFIGWRWAAGRLSRSAAWEEALGATAVTLGVDPVLVPTGGSRQSDEE